MKTMESIYEEMKAQYAALTGSVPAEGGDLTLRLYTAAAQLYALWEQAAFVLRQSVPQMAVGEHLDHHAAMRGITRRPGTHAAGTLRFSVDRAAGQDISIPIGTTCTSAAGTAFETTQAGTLSAGELYCDVPARAVLSGTGETCQWTAWAIWSWPPPGYQPAAILSPSPGAAERSLTRASGPGS